MPKIDWPQIRRFVGLLTGSATQFVSLAILSLILAKYLTVEEFGVTRTVASYMIVLTILGHMTIHDALATFVAGAKNTKDKSQYVTHGVTMVTCLSALLTIAFYLFVTNSDMWTGLTKESLSTVVLILPLECLSGLVLSLLNAAGNLRTMAVFSGAYGVIPLGIIAPSAILWGMQGWLYARLISCCIVFGFGAFLVRKFLRMNSVDFNKAMDLVRFARVQFLSGALSTVMLSGDIIVLERLTRDSRAVAHYGLAVLFTRPLAFVPATLGKLYFREIASTESNPTRQWKSIRRLLGLSLAICFLLALVVFTFGGALLSRLYGIEYQDSIPVLEILSVNILFSGLWSALSTTNIAIRKPSFSAITSVAGLIAATIMFVIFVPSTGALGAAWGMTAANLTGCAIGLFLLWRKWRQSNQARDITCAQ